MLTYSKHARLNYHFNNAFFNNNNNTNNNNNNDNNNNNFIKGERNKFSKT